MKFLNRRISHLFVIFCSSIFSCSDGNLNTTQTDDIELDILLVGTFHFANFNPENNGDLVQVKVRDILTKENQQQLELISKKIADYNPDKIFVEYPFKSQKKLDSIYSTFSKADFTKVRRNETIQLGFRTAKKLNHKRVFAMDLRTNFPMDSLLTQMKKAKQFTLLAKDSLDLESIEKQENLLFNSNTSLSEILFYYNDDLRRKADINWYVNLANQGGEKDNFVGAYLASEWYKRNLYMYSIIQKAIENNDKKIMILGGASHIAMFKEFIALNPKWQTIELEEVMSL